MRSFDPWPALASIRRFEILVERTGANGGPAHSGRGEVRVDQSGSKLIWYEEGTWIGGPLAGTRFHNVSQWIREPETSTIALSHLRRGKDAPTFLARLSEASPGRWIAEAPHLCGADIYQPTLETRPEGLSLSWEVTSPTDPYRLRFEGWTDSTR